MHLNSGYDLLLQQGILGDLGRCSWQDYFDFLENQRRLYNSRGLITAILCLCVVPDTGALLCQCAIWHIVASSGHFFVFDTHCLACLGHFLQISSYRIQYNLFFADSLFPGTYLCLLARAPVIGGPVQSLLPKQTYLCLPGPM